jgi:hypothetical protein
MCFGAGGSVVKHVNRFIIRFFHGSLSVSRGADYLFFFFDLTFMDQLNNLKVLPR